MNYIIGASLFLLGATIAFFGAGNSHAAWVTLGALLTGWFLLAVYGFGVRNGKRHNYL